MGGVLPMCRGLCVFWVCVLSMLSASVFGCRQTVRLAGSAVRQNPLRRIGPSGGWTFNGLDARVPPSYRPGSYASATRRVTFLDPADLGPHGYRFDGAERSGIVYTCRAGHIDIAHVRKAIDWTGYLAAVVLDRIEAGRTTFQFKQIEPSLYHVDLTFPDDWTDLDDGQRERIAREVACDLGAHLAWTGLTWHEILTWFGYRFKIWQSEFPSAFSWEDNYSNLLGTRIAVAALGDESRPFDEVVTDLLDEWLVELGAQPAEAAEEITGAMRDRWFSSQGFFTVIHERNFDIGLDDGHVTPRLAPTAVVCDDPEPRPLAIPTLDRPARHGFLVRVQIEPRVWEERRILTAAFGPSDEATGPLEPVVAFPLLMDYIERDAVARGIPRAESEVAGK